MIVRTEKSKNYTIVANYALNDVNLSLKAKGLWAFLMSKPDVWKVSSSGLQSQLKEGRDAILAALQELEDAGYLERRPIRGENGRLSGSETVVYEQNMRKSRDTENTSLGNGNRIVSTKEQVNTKKDIKHNSGSKSVDTTDVPPHLTSALDDLIKHRKALKRPMTREAIRLTVAKLQNWYPAAPAKQVAAINQAIERGWIGVFELKDEPESGKGMRF